MPTFPANPTLEQILDFAEQYEANARAETWLNCPCVVSETLFGFNEEELEAQIKVLARAAGVAFYKNQDAEAMNYYLRHCAARLRFLRSETGDSKILELTNEQ